MMIDLKNIDDIVALIRKSREGIAELLMNKFGLSKKQADAILEMKAEEERFKEFGSLQLFFPPLK